MLITIHQPDFLPWLGFFDRWEKSDLFILLDDVQFIRRGWHHRDRILTPSGVDWLTVPVKKKGRYLQKINEVEIDYSGNWTARHLNVIRSAYRKSPGFGRIFGRLSAIVLQDFRKLADLNLELLRFCADLLEIDTPVIRASSLQVSSTGTGRLVDLVKSAGGRRYLSGLGARAYLDEDAFRANEIDLIWQNFDHPVYPQLNGGFHPMLSVLDYIMMEPDPSALFNRIGGEA